MKTLPRMLLTLLLALPLAGLAGDGQVLDIQVKGMSCPFCVYGVEKHLKGLPGVDSASVDLKQNRARSPIWRRYARPSPMPVSHRAR